MVTIVTNHTTNKVNPNFNEKANQDTCLLNTIFAKKYSTGMQEMREVIANKIPTVISSKLEETNNKALVIRYLIKAYDLNLNANFAAQLDDFANLDDKGQKELVKNIISLVQEKIRKSNNPLKDPIFAGPILSHEEKVNLAIKFNCGGWPAKWKECFISANKTNPFTTTESFTAEKYKNNNISLVKESPATSLFSECFPGSEEDFMAFSLMGINI